MKTIQVFIASSEELKIERLEFTDMLQELSRILNPRGIGIVPVKWEYLDASMSPLHKQEEYIRELKNCEICLVLYWTKFGEYTERELNAAYMELCAGRNPKKLYVYFKDTDIITPELQAFKESFIPKYGHFYCRFENVDTMRLNFLLQLESYLNNGADSQEGLLKIRDSKVEVGGKPIADLHRIPFAANNPGYQELLHDIRKAQERVLKYPGDRELRQELHDLEQKREEMERSLLNTAKHITRLSTAACSARLAEAVRLFGLGDNRGADAVLNLAGIENDADANARRIDAARELETEARRALEINIEELQLKILTLQNEMADGWVTSAIAIYDKAVAMARNRIEPEKFAALLRSYADFLQANKQYHLIGSLYEECLTIYRQLAFVNPATFETDVAGTLKNSAIFHGDTGQYMLAEKEYQEVLVIYQELAEQNPEIFLVELAGTFNNLAILYAKKREYSEAIEEYDNSLRIYRHLSKQNPRAFISDIARTINNMAISHEAIQEYDTAQELYYEALTIRYTLAQENPNVFAKSFAITLNNLGILHVKIQQYDKAEIEFHQALTIHRHLAEENPEANEFELAKTLNNSAYLYHINQQYNLAFNNFFEALKIYEKLAEKNPEAFEEYVASTCKNLASLYEDIQQYDLAKKKYQESLEIYRRLAESSPEAFESDLAGTLFNFAILHKEMGQIKLSEQDFFEALALYRKSAVRKNPIYKENIQQIEQILKEYFQP